MNHPIILAPSIGYFSGDRHELATHGCLFWNFDIFGYPRIAGLGAERSPAYNSAKMRIRTKGTP